MNEQGDHGEGAPGGREIVGVNEGVNGGIWEGGGSIIWIRVVLEDAVVTWSSGLGDDGKGGGLEGADERFGF